MKTSVTPAQVALFVREHGPIARAEVYEHFGVSPPEASSRMTGPRELLSFALEQLVAAGLVERRPGARTLADIYEVTPQLQVVQRALGISLSALAESEGNPHESECEALFDLAQRVVRPPLNVLHYAPMLSHALEEMSKCLRASCYVAVMGLAGKLLEITIKHSMVARSIDFQEDWMLGTLLRKFEVDGGYLDPGLKNIANLINVHRISSVHAKQNVPPPSSDQALMVVRASLDVIKRLICEPAERA